MRESAGKTAHLAGIAPRQARFAAISILRLKSVCPSLSVRRPREILFLEVDHGLYRLLDYTDEASV